MDVSLLIVTADLDFLASVDEDLGRSAPTWSLSQADGVCGVERALQSRAYDAAVVDARLGEDVALHILSSTAQ